MSELLKEYMLHNYKTMEREKVEQLFNLKRIEYGTMMGILYRENEEIRDYINNKVMELRKKRVRNLEVARQVGLNYNIVCDICNGILRQDKKEIVNKKSAFEIKKERYWKFIQYLFIKHKQKVIDLKCNSGEDYDILKLLNLENKISLLPPTEKNCCVRIKLGGINV